MDFSKFIDWIKLSPKYLIPISLVCGLLIFAEEKLLNVFGLANFVAKAKPYLGIIFLLSTGLILSNIIIAIYHVIRKIFTKTQGNKKRIEKLHTLNRCEKEVLFSYLFKDTRTQYFPANSGELIELLAYHILYEPSTFGDVFEWPYNIHPWAFEYLKTNYREIFTVEEEEKLIERVKRMA